MVCTEIIREFSEPDSINVNFLNPVLTLLTNMNKYTTIPVYFLQVLVSKVTYLPKYIVTAYDNLDLITNTSAAVPHLEDIIHQKMPKTITPSAIVYPEDIQASEVLYKKNENYVYSTVFLVSGKELKDALKNETILIKRILIKSDMNRREFQVDIEWTDNIYDEVTKLPIEQPEMISPITDSLVPLHLPFSNYVKSVSSYKDIVEHITNMMASNVEVGEKDQGYKYSEKNIGKNLIESMVTNVKEENMICLPDGNTSLFKDFIKVKPTTFRYWACNSKINDDVETRNVCLDMYIKSSKCNVMLFYRYFDKLVNEIVGKYKEKE